MNDKKIEAKPRIWNSITGMVILIIAIVVVVLSVGVILNVSTNSVNMTKNIYKNFMMDMSKVASETVVGINPTGKATAEMIAEPLSKMGINGVSSSYFYVVEEDGMMLYHKSSEKIGKPVENEAVKQIVIELKSGRIPEPQVITYEYKGVEKYAAINVTPFKQIVVLTADEEELISPVDEMMRKVVITLLSSITFCMIVGIILSRWITKPIGCITETIHQIGKLDFTHFNCGQKVFERKDEIGIIGRATISLIDELKEIIVQIEESADSLDDFTQTFATNFNQISNNVQNINESISNINEGAASQANDTQVVAEQMSNMGESVAQTTNSVKELLTNTDEMRQYNVEAEHTLDELILINVDTSKSIKMVNEQTHVTNQSANEIQSAIDIISDIASQTNMLSLNASIEAARAGEHGKGFAVVAEEVRKLADQSQESVSKISDIIDRLISNSNVSVNTMNDVIKKVEYQSNKLNDTKKVFDSLNSNINSVVSEMKNISSMLGNIDDAKRTVTDSISDLAAVSQQNAAATQTTSQAMSELENVVEECNKSTEILRQLAGMLEENMSKFTV